MVRMGGATGSALDDGGSGRAAAARDEPASEGSRTATRELGAPSSVVVFEVRDRRACFAVAIPHM